MRLSIEDLLKEKLIIELSESWSLGTESLQCISSHVKPRQNTIETGIGYSTLLFASIGSDHQVHFISKEAQGNITSYAQLNNIDLSNVQFVLGPSQYTLPSVTAAFDFALIDGDHAFPIPIIDFYYIGKRTKIGGHILIDDIPIRSVYDIYGFAKTSKHWRLVEVLDCGRCILLQKLSDSFFPHEWFGTQDYNLLVPPKITMQPTIL
jgi:hypothetical protein